MAGGGGQGTTDLDFLNAKSTWWKYSECSVRQPFSNFSLDSLCFSEGLLISLQTSALDELLLDELLLDELLLDELRLDELPLLPMHSQCTPNTLLNHCQRTPKLCQKTLTT